MSERITLAIDGPAGAGKSTIAKRVAQRLGCLYLDTGAMYRAVGLAALEQGVAFTDTPKLAALAAQVQVPLRQEIMDRIRTPEVATAASAVAKVQAVRTELVKLQQAYGARESVVMEGRDIGTVVFPRATLKVYLDADPRVRAERRVAEWREQGKAADVDSTEAAMAKRDRDDKERVESPLELAPDAVRLDTTGLSLDQVEERILTLLDERIHAKEENKR